MSRGCPEAPLVDVMVPGSFGDRIDRRCPADLEGLRAVPGAATHGTAFTIQRGAGRVRHVYSSRRGHVLERSSRSGLSGRIGPARQRIRELWLYRVPPGAVLRLIVCVACGLRRSRGQDFICDGGLYSSTGIQD